LQREYTGPITESEKKPTNIEIMMPEHKFLRNLEKPDENSITKGKTDGMFYENNAPVTATKPTNLQLAKAYIEFKRDPAYNIFKDPKSNTNFTNQERVSFMPKSEQRWKTLAQMAFYAEEINSRQRRCHQFSIYACTNQLRLFRWDQASVIASRAFTF
jgi:hypothetical protein